MVSTALLSKEEAHIDTAICMKFLNRIIFSQVYENLVEAKGKLASNSTIKKPRRGNHINRMLNSLKGVICVLSLNIPSSLLFSMFVKSQLCLSAFYMTT